MKPESKWRTDVLTGAPSGSLSHTKFGTRTAFISVCAVLLDVYNSLSQ